MKITEIKDPPVPKPPLKVSIELDQTEAAIMLCIFAQISGHDTKKAIDKTDISDFSETAKEEIKGLKTRNGPSSLNYEMYDALARVFANYDS